MNLRLEEIADQIYADHRIKNIKLSGGGTSAVEMAENVLFAINAVSRGNAKERFDID